MAPGNFFCKNFSAPEIFMTIFWLQESFLKNFGSYKFSTPNNSWAQNFPLKISGSKIFSKFLTLNFFSHVFRPPNFRLQIFLPTIFPIKFSLSKIFSPINSLFLEFFPTNLNFFFKRILTSTFFCGKWPLIFDPKIFGPQTLAFKFPPLPNFRFQKFSVAVSAPKLQKSQF